MKISLLQNANGFLEEALSKAITAEEYPMHWKYATLNLVQAIELSLKEKLRRDHPILVFDKVDSPKNTVNLTTALNRLQNISKLKFSQADISSILKASQIRNHIIHFEFELNSEENKIIFAKLLGFMSHFHITHLDNALDEVIPVELWQEAINIIEYAEELFERATCIFDEKGFDPLLIWTCSHCEWNAFVTQDGINTCYVCGYRSDIVKCPDCEEQFYDDDCHELQTGDEQFEKFCTACYEKRISEDEGYYREMMSYYWDK